jgi:hypothetical protein
MLLLGVFDCFGSTLGPLHGGHQAAGQWAGLYRAGPAVSPGACRTRTSRGSLVGPRLEVERRSPSGANPQGPSYCLSSPNTVIAWKKLAIWRHAH